jgi:hypothetical protein
VTDWERVERVLDDRAAAHACAFCGGAIALGDTTRWGLAVRAPTGQTSVVWIHPECLRTRLHPSMRSAFNGPVPGPPLT